MATSIEGIGCDLNTFCSDKVVTRTDPLELNCSGFKRDRTPMTLAEINNFWSKNGIGCKDKFGSIIFEGPGIKKFNPDNYRRVQQDMTYLLNTSFGGNAINFSPTTSAGLQDNLFFACKDDFNLLGACEPYINSVLSMVYPDYGTMAKNTQLSNWQGCYIPPTNETTLYSSFGDDVLTLPDGDRGNAPCWPMCHRVSTIQLFKPTDGEKYSCNNNVCVIDNVVIDENNSSVGKVSINQICTQCNPNELCECIISSNNMQESFDELGLSSNYTSFCGDTGICYELDTSGALIPTDCTSYLGSGGGQAFSSAIPWIVFLIVVVIFLIFIGVFLSLSKQTYVKETPTSNIQRDDNNEGNPVKYSWQLTSL
jgi:hypothetical protein